MKGFVLTAIVAFVAATGNAFAFGNAPSATYWVVEKGKKSGTIRLYNDQHELVKQLPAAKNIDIRRKKHRKYLDSLLAVHNGTKTSC